MAVFVTQLIRIVLSIVTPFQQLTINFVFPIMQMLFVSKRSVHFYFFSFSDDILPG